MFLGGGRFQLSCCFVDTSNFVVFEGWYHARRGWWRPRFRKMLSRFIRRYRTPVGSVMFLGAVTMAAAAGANAGAGNQEAFQFLMNGMVAGDAASHVLVFAIPLVAGGEGHPGPCAWRRSAVSA
jgi:hypothetical protein